MEFRHGQRLYDQARQIDQKLSRLLPLLALIGDTETGDGEEANSDPDPDPVQIILDALERVIEQQTSNAVALQNLDQKLSLVLAHLPADAP